GENSTQVSFSGAIPVANIAFVMTPVPGPSSSTGRPERISITDAIRRAVKLLVGTIEPTARGLSIQPLKNFSSSSKRLASDLRGVSAIRVSPPDRTYGR